MIESLTKKQKEFLVSLYPNNWVETDSTAAQKFAKKNGWTEMYRNSSFIKLSNSGKDIAKAVIDSSLTPT